MAKILIADGYPLVRYLVSTLVIDAGHEVVLQAKDGLEALKLYKEMDPDLLIMDYKLLMKQGFSLLTEIMEMDPKAKIILLASAVKEIQFDRVMHNVTVVSKPFELEHFMQSVEAALG